MAPANFPRSNEFDFVDYRLSGDSEWEEGESGESEDIANFHGVFLVWQVWFALRRRLLGGADNCANGEKLLLFFIPAKAVMDGYRELFR